MESIGKNAKVAPYTGHMLAIAVRSRIDSELTAGPKNSTNLPATSNCRRHYKNVSVVQMNNASLKQSHFNHCHKEKLQMENITTDI